MTKRLLMALLMIASPASAQAPSQWRLVNSDRKEVVFVDQNRIEKKGEIVTVWSLIALKNPIVENGKQYDTVIEHARYDCNGRTDLVISISLFSGLDFIATEEPLVYQDIIPDSINDNILNAGCYMRFKSPTSDGTMPEALASARAMLSLPN